MNLGPMEIGLVLAVVLVLFGSRRLPELGSGLGSMITNFRKSFREGQAIDVTPKVEAQEREKIENQTKQPGE